MAFKRIVLLSAFVASGCSGWHTQRVEPESLLARHLSKVLVRRTDGSDIVVHSPTLRNDSLVGTRRARHTEQEVQIALNDVEELATRDKSTGLTLLLIGAIAAAVLLAGLIFVGATYFPSN